MADRRPSRPGKIPTVSLNEVKAAPGGMGQDIGQETGMNLQEAQAILGAVRRHEVKRLAAHLASLQRQTAVEKQRLAAARLILRHK